MNVFSHFNLDKDGCINVEDFKTGMKRISKSMSRKMERRKSRNGSLSNWSPPQEHETRTLQPPMKHRKSSIANEAISVFSCEEKICDFYERMDITYPELAENFNDIVEIMINDVKEINREKQNMSDSYQREKMRFEDRMHHLEEEYESQIQQICNTETRQEIEKIEKDFLNTMQKKDREINHLQERLHEVEEENLRASRAGSDVSPLQHQLQQSSVMELTEQLSRTSRENTALQVQLTASQTDLAVVRSDKTTMKQQLFDRIAQLQHEKNTMKNLEKDSISLKKQLQTLREVNRKLQDTNDSLRSAIESSPSATDILRRASTCPSTKDDKLMLECDPVYVSAQQQQQILFQKHRGSSCGPDSLVDEHGDSGLSTLRDVAELVSEVEPVVSIVKPFEMRTADDDVFVEFVDKSNLSLGDNTVVSNPSVSRDDRSFGVQRRRKQRSNDRRYTSSRRYQKQQEAGAITSDEDLPLAPSVAIDIADRGRSNKVMTNKEAAPAIATRPRGNNTMPESMFKVVFAGDASVGKSTFMLRLCTDSFVSDCQATIGIDFRTKSLEVDGKMVGLQLWDTAGQERFRSMTANYFRKADGVLLLYDSVYETSFLNVREWVESIRSSAGEDIPIVLVGNKSDLRDRYAAEGRRVVSHELGAHLATEKNMIFAETSAKEGQNIHDCVEQLTRALIKNQDQQTNSSRIEIGKSATKLPTSSSCCK